MLATQSLLFYRNIKRPAMSAKSEYCNKAVLNRAFLLHIQDFHIQDFHNHHLEASDIIM